MDRPGVWDHRGASKALLDVRLVDRQDVVVGTADDADVAVDQHDIVGASTDGDHLQGFLPALVADGLLDANNGHLRTLWGEAGLLEYEFADDTAADYETYDAVAQDRTAAAAAG